jgi:hypothetical protein
MLNKLFLNCYISIDFIPDSKIDRKVAKAALLTSLFVYSLVTMSYSLCCLIRVFSYNKIILLTLTILSILGTYFHYVTNNRGRNVIDNVQWDKNKRIWVLILTFLSIFGLLLLDMYIMAKFI